ncbi:YggT family protein [uncultured Jatrophihabitans sp.]|uniref:YggT family protein n=1 Tax=uncultured Jatrophihabitans sp. TaxID=1610747 RepID=UPI0035CA2D2F
MSLLWQVIGYALWLYIVLILARIVIEWTRQFARKWRPVGAAAVGLELVYVATDPPIRLLRRLVPPLQLGTVSLDLSVIILLIVLIVLRVVALDLA